jgi:hypothetical protein
VQHSEQPLSPFPELPAEPLTRRSALRRLTVAAGGTSLLATGITASRVAAADSKMAKSAVGYQDTPQGEAECGNCEQFHTNGHKE